VLEGAEGVSDLAGMVDAVYGIVGMGSLHVTDGAPEMIFPVDIKIQLSARLQDARHLPEMSLLTGPRAHVFCKNTHILHDQSGLLEYLCIDAL